MLYTILDIYLQKCEMNFKNKIVFISTYDYTLFEDDDGKYILFLLFQIHPHFLNIQLLIFNFFLSKLFNDINV
jgi:hypothetical protein